MAVIIGSARIDENGRIMGGKAGDQTGNEVSTQNWYLHKKGWVVIRAKSAEVREKIAQDMQYICDNPHIGYDQGQNTTLYMAAKPYGFNASKVKTPCETDCARAVRVCVLYAGIHVGDFYTGSEEQELESTGQFDVYTSDKYCKSSQYLVRGDILVTRTKGHTVVVLTNGPKAGGHETLRRRSKGADVRELQRALNTLGITDADGEDLVVDGSYGKRTEEAVKTFQRANHLAVDGVCGPITWAAIDAAVKKKEGVAVRVTTLLNCRTGAETQWPVKCTLEAGGIYHYTHEAGDWIYLIEPKGWVNRKYVEVVS